MNLPSLGLVAALVLTAPLSLTNGVDDAAVPTIAPTVVVPPDLRASVLDLPEALRTDLRYGRWDRVLDGLDAVDTSTLNGPQRGALAFVKGLGGNTGVLHAEWKCGKRAPS